MINGLFDISRFIPSEVFTAEFFSSMIVMLVMLILSLIVYFKSKKANPLEKPKGILLLAEIYVNFIDKTVLDNMGENFKKIFTPIFSYAYLYIFLGMMWGLTGLSSPFTFLAVPLSLGLLTFSLIHIVAAYYNRIKYFHRYIEPFAVFLPINLISMWSPLLSLSFRLFGNALAGYVILELVYGVFRGIHIGEFSLGFFAVVATPVLHAYFDVFGAYIQTTVFTLLSMQLIAAERPEDGKIYYSKRKLKKMKDKYEESISNAKEEALVTDK